MGRTTLRVTLFLFAVLALNCRLGMAQMTKGNLVGIVTDPSGAMVAGASVEAVNDATHVKTTVTTGTNGQYRFTSIPIGHYTLTVTAQGFAPAELKDVSVLLNETATADVALSVGKLATSVEVTQAPAEINTTDAQIQTNFNSTEAADLPLASSTSGGTGVLNLSLLSAGVANAGGVGEGEGPSVGGQRPRNNNFTVEGIDNNEKTTTGSLAFIPNDSVAEFTVLQNQFSAEFGHSSGGQFNTVLKSGTNTVHGSLYDYMQNRNLMANDVANYNSGITSTPRFDQNRLGATIGGPIIKDKLFYFGDMEYNPLGQSSSPTSPFFAPTAAGYATIATIPGISTTNYNVVKQYLGAAPSASSTITVGTTSIPVGVLPISAPNYENNYNGVGSVDYVATDKDRMQGRFVYNHDASIDTTAVIPAFFAPQPTTIWLTTFSEYHNFAPTVTNEFRLGYERFNQQYPVPDVNFPGLDQFPNLGFDDLGVLLGPDQNAPQYTVQNTYQLTDNLTWIRGGHTFTFGFDGRKYISPQSFTQRSRGDYEYSTLSNYLFDFTPDSIAQRSLGNSTYYGDQISTFAYGNDSWKMNPHLTINLGLRWEFTSVPYSERLQNLNAEASVPGLINFTTPQPQWHNFAPRVGIAYSPGTSGHTVIRTGFGMAYDVIFDNIGILALPPQFSTTIDVTAPTPGVGPGFLAGGGIPPTTPLGTLTPAEARAETAAFIPNQQLPYSINWNFGIQHEFAQNYVFEARYLGTRGVHLDVQTRPNIGDIVNSSNALPVFFNTPSAAQLSGLTNNLGSLLAIENANPAFNSAAIAAGAPGYILPQYANAGFYSPITEDAPVGWSSYNGLALQLTRRFSHGLQLLAAYTWSHNIDNSTADFFSTVLTPRRPQDFQDLTPEKSDSALDRRQRFTIAELWDTPFFQTSNSWFMKNLIGNWQLSGFYTYESPEYATVQSAIDANLNGDTFTDRSFINTSGVPNTSSGVTAINSSGTLIPASALAANPALANTVVAYVANNPNAQYLAAGVGTLPNGGRNTIPIQATNNIDLALMKRFSITERVKLQLQGQASNLFNHPQFTGGYIDHVDAANPTLVGFLTSVGTRNMLTPGNASFDRPDLAFSSNPRVITVVAKFIF